MAKNNETSLTPSRTLPLAKADDLLPIGISFESLQENLADLDQINLPRIRIGDDKFYMSQQDEEGTAEFEGMIQYFVRQNTYWSSGYDPKNITPPECYSLDGKTGSKYGDCRTCKYNQFRSAPNGGAGKACRNQIKLFIQLDGKAIPLTMLISPVNIAAFSQNYLVDTLAQRGLPYWKVRTKFTVSKLKGEKFGRIKCEIAGEYRDDELTKVKKIREFWLKVVEQETRTLPEMEDHSHPAAPITGTTAAAPENPGKVVTPTASPKSEPPKAVFSDEDLPF